VTSARWDAFVRRALIDAWLAEYACVSDWSTQVLEIEQGELTFLFDAGPTLTENRLGKGEDRVVAAWGHSQRPAVGRDRRRLAGFLPFPRLWSGAKRDRGHFIAHASGGRTDLNLFPQATALIADAARRGDGGGRWSATPGNIRARRCSCVRSMTALVGRPRRWTSRSSRTLGARRALLKPGVDRASVEAVPTVARKFSFAVRRSVMADQPGKPS
jgi:hypothetical protein